jgi:AcrR family transcriptional regulator
MTTRTKNLSVIDPDHKPEGAHPVKQERSRILRHKVLEFAQSLVIQGRFTTTSMADIARAAGCSVGALYFRFHDKDALFASVVEVAMTQEVEKLQVQVDAGRYKDLSLKDTVDRCVQDYMDFVRRNELMICALYQRSSDEPGYWGLVRMAAFRMVQIWIGVVALAADRPNDRAFMRQVGTAFWFVSSSLVYAVLVIDQPVRPLSTREQHFWLNQMVMHFIGLDLPEPMHQSAVMRPKHHVACNSPCQNSRKSKEQK